MAVPGRTSGARAMARLSEACSLALLTIFLSEDTDGPPLAAFSPDPPLDPSLDPPLPELPAQASTEAPAVPTPRRAPSRTNFLREILSFKSFSP